MSNHDRIELGHLNRYWDQDFKELTYVKQPVTQEEIDDWNNLGYDQKNVKSFTGSLYDSRNVMPDWTKNLEFIFGLYNQTYTIYRMETLEIMPVHRDHFRTYCRLNDVTPDRVYRVILMLEDWKPGHYFEMDGVGYVNWKAGDWFKWRGDVPHSAANIGSEPRYTMQITGMSVYDGQLNDLFPFNIPGLKEKTNHPFVNNDIRPKINSDNISRYMVYMNNSTIKELADINHDDDTIRLLNEDGLHIYLYEPLCSYHVDSVNNVNKHTQGFYSEFDHTVDPKDLRADELDSIYDYADKNNLTNITVHTCDYNVDKWYPVYSHMMTLICDDLFIRTQKPIINLNENVRQQFHKHFICLNWRFTKHRQLVSTYLAGQDGYLSWSYKAQFDVLNKDLYFDLNGWKQTHKAQFAQLQIGCDNIIKHSPYYVDAKPNSTHTVEDPWHVAMWPDVKDYASGVTPALYNRVSNNLAEVYGNAFVDIINETRFAQPTGNFSEKVFQAVQYLRPFIVVGPPKTLEYIKSLGFKTFDEFWDESYDDETDHSERLAKIFAIIDNILTLSIEEMRELYTKMLPIVQHNLQTYKEFIK